MLLFLPSSLGSIKPNQEKGGIVGTQTPPLNGHPFAGCSRGGKAGAAAREVALKKEPTTDSGAHGSAGSWNGGLWMLMALRVAKECGGWVCLDLHRGGDFNVVLSQRERSSQGRISGAMRRFAQVVDELELLDLPLQGGVFSWSGAEITKHGQDWIDSSCLSAGWINGGGLRRGPSPFRFENMWLKVDGFKDLLREWWQGTVVRGKASFRLASKLKVLKQKIKEWNREVFGRLEVNKSLALQQVEFWDRVESERSLNPLETNVEGVVAEGGDKNSGFFHRMANAHRRTNSMDRIKINGVWRTEEQEVREGIVQNFQQLLTEEPSWRADIEGLHLPRLNTCEAEGLEVPFTMEEIHSALMDMNGDKAPGPDGFTGAFWQTCWEFVKEEIMDLFKEFFVQKSFAKSLNTTFLKKVLGKVVSMDQNAFVRGRQILDASLIANEVVDFCLTKDGIWESLDGVDLVVHFNCQIFYLGEWVPAGFFPSSKGLRQGDPLSPYLFVMGMEVLSALIRRAVRGGFVSGCSLKGRGGLVMEVSHLLFADDTIIFCEAKKEYLTSLSWILAWFEAASGLRINLAKSELIPIGEVEEIEEMAVELGCKVGALPSVYLGLPLGANHKAISMWDGVEERMRRRLALWKRQYISKGGRITLIKSTLASIPIYQLSFFGCQSQ
ncbi:putative mitochondrial protein [Vitis vinifera]|uniref:Putative mitochondrial protein n=1 Tax=Vitis vinifera TaxID=29760 RepID=A0A438C1V0_VITVI|nr:putative mitochondrial protein [Vitis vinifera]